MTKEEQAYSNYLHRVGAAAPAPLQAALIDMDGVLYDSMKHHAASWNRLAGELGWKTEPNEFYLYEGMTGKAVIKKLMMRDCGKTVTDDEAAAIYARKSQYFSAMGEVDPIPDTNRVLDFFVKSGITCVLVTGSGQHTLLDRLDRDYSGVFAPDLRVTALDVHHGKPDPEPYLMGLKKSGKQAENAIVVENAPLGVKAGNAAGCFTVAVTTGPIPEEILYAHGADIVYPDMAAFAAALPALTALRTVNS